MTGNVKVTRIQTGIRIEKRKELAEYPDLTLSDWVEGIVLHAFDGKSPFQAATLLKIKEINKVYDLELDASHIHKLVEIE